ncbi:acyl-CoA dehydrogenase family protein [Falsigemmobacter faecalis]|uniref:Acyl-CoA dehydrogenase/oxidase C-terminal domain-containing protein n=1 Tax=Falsigemmobacter faecalis TaxID=2488730 RepID=A0A3P3DDP8_9RHOB|nr:acyl-CoA dehydrogenase family protein [Falsigemmobacter faecalis]RRH72411.1 hypothetical protein EG244_14980 [Falsigemmobacter faecalis]
MSTDLIRDSAERLFGPKGGSRAPAALWRETEAAGFGLALLSEAEGGFGLSTRDALEPLIIAARCAAPVPLAETMLANWLLARSGQGPSENASVVVSDLAQPVLWGPAATEVLWLDPEGHVTRLPAGVCTWTPLSSLSGEPMERLLPPPPGGIRFDPGVSAMHLRAMAALLRAAQISGALEGVVQLSVSYAAGRVQFGRALAGFQTIRHYLAQMANQAAAARAGIAMAAAAADQGDVGSFIALVAAARIRAGEAVGPVTDLAHQIHGAIGFSEDYPLHQLTRRLWLWRDLDGDEAYWSAHLGARLMAGKERGLWAQITELQGGSL